MATDAPSAREVFLRDRFGRGIAIARGVFDRRLLYAAYLLAGLCTAILCFATSPLIVAIVFTLYVAGLALFFGTDRRRVDRAIVAYESVLTEHGPEPEPVHTRDLPRYLLAVDDAIDVPMLDAILNLKGDSLEEFIRYGSAVRKNMLAYQVALIWFLPASILLIIGFVALFVDHGGFQIHLAEVTLVGLALVPSVVALRDINRYSSMSERINLGRVVDAERYLASQPAAERPFIDGRVVKFRDGKYVIDKRALHPPVDSASVERRRRSGRTLGGEFLIGIGALVSIAVFVVHPISGILVP
jgi:hypothetical protein